MNCLRDPGRSCKKLAPSLSFAGESNTPRNSKYRSFLLRIPKRITIEPVQNRSGSRKIFRNRLYFFYRNSTNCRGMTRLDTELESSTL
jgi:hypothetical protein